MMTKNSEPGDTRRRRRLYCCALGCDRNGAVYHCANHGGTNRRVLRNSRKHTCAKCGGRGGCPAAGGPRMGVVVRMNDFAARACTPAAVLAGSSCFLKVHVCRDLWDEVLARAVWAARAARLAGRGLATSGEPADPSTPMRPHYALNSKDSLGRHDVS